MNRKFLGGFLSACCLFGEGFGSGLDGMVDKVLQNSHRLKSLIYQQEAAIHRIDQAKGAYKPQVNFSLMYGWDRFRPYYANRDIEQTLNYYYLSVSQSVYNPEALAKIKQYREYKELADLKVQQQRLYITYVFLDSLLTYKISKQMLDRYAESVELLKEKSELLNLLYLSKRVGAEDVAKVQADLMSATVELNQIKAKMEVAKQTVENMIQDRLDEGLELNQDLQGLFLPFDAFLSRLEDNHDVKIAKKNVEIAKREVDVRKAAWYPRVSVVGSYLKSNTTSMSVAKEDTRLVASVDYPVYNGGVSPAVLEAQKLLMSANEELKEVIKNTERELIKAYGVYSEAFGSIQELEKGLEEKREALRLVEEAFGKGYATRLMVIDRRLDYVSYDVRLKGRMQEFYSGLLRVGFLVGDGEFIKKVFK